MKLNRLIERLVDPAAYPHPAEKVEVHQTHISVVFLAGPFAYKIKKPIHLDFLDYSTLEKRRHFCEQEVALNRRLAPTVYLGVVPVIGDGDTIKIDASGEPIEWAVKMARLPEEATFRDRLQVDQIQVSQVEALGIRIAQFHAQAEAGPHIAAVGRFEVVAQNARENFEQSESHVGSTISRSVFDRLRELTEKVLLQHRTLIEARAARGVPRDTHGDLRLGHVYLFPDQQPPDDLVIVDCIEFGERFRYSDPVADTAFLAMDFVRSGRRDLSRAFTEAYFRASHDTEGQTLLPFYTAYRAAVRGKVEGMQSTEQEISAADRTKALYKARASWLVALGELEAPGQKPCLLLVGGLPGSGKSTLARDLSQQADFAVIRSDLVRKELAGLGGGTSASSEYEAGIYDRRWNERTYAECSRQAEALLFEGKRVLVDASFGKESMRKRFFDLATHYGVPIVFFLCDAEPEVVRTRLETRRNDASDADWSIYVQAAARWESVGPATRNSMRVISTDGDQEQTSSQAIQTLRDLGLMD